MEDKFGGMMENIKDPQSLMYFLKKNKKDVIFWIIGLAIIGFVYFFLSSRDYSFLIVLSSFVQMLSFLIIILKVIGYESCSGLSYNSALCYTILLSARLSSTLFFHGYLPSDEAGDWFYQLTEIITLLCSISLLILIKGKYQENEHRQ